jgi:hypothetical protein
MKTKDELERFFQREILPNISIPQAQPDKAKKNRMLFGGFFAALFVLALAKQAALSFLLFFGFIVYFVFTRDKSSSKKRRRTIRSYQRLVVKPLINEIDPTLHYSPSRGVSYNGILASKLVEHYHTKRFTANNLITYENDGLSVRLSHVYLEHKVKEGDYAPALAGLFAVTDARRPATGKTIVSFDLAERFLGFVGQGLQFKTMYRGLEKIRLDSPGFEKQYVVHASDRIEANYLLSHTVMEKLTQLIEEYRLFPRISFVKDKVYVAVLDHGFFQPFSWSKQLRFKDLEKSIDALCFAREVIKAIHHHHRL